MAETENTTPEDGGLMETVTGHDAEDVCTSPDLPAYDARTAESLAALGMSGRSTAVPCEADHWHVTE